MFRFATALTLLVFSLTKAQDDADYGVDCSFPIHSYDWKCGDKLGNRQKIYEEFMAGCYEKHGSKGWRCKETEDDRLAMSLRQPQSMVK